MICGQTCDGLYHFAFCLINFGIPFGSQPIKSALARHSGVRVYMGCALAFVLQGRFLCFHCYMVHFQGSVSGSPQSLDYTQKSTISTLAVKFYPQVDCHTDHMSSVLSRVSSSYYQFITIIVIYLPGCGYRIIIFASHVSGRGNILGASCLSVCVWASVCTLCTLDLQT